LRGYRSAAAGVAIEEPSIATPVQSESLPLDADLVGFWSGIGGSLIHTVPTTPKNPPLLRQLGDPPGGITKDLEAVYKAISAEAELWLGL
jgi:hypothetical protein